MTEKGSKNNVKTDANVDSRRFYLAALGAYVSLWEERDQIRKNLSERGEKMYTRLSQQVGEWQKQIRETLGR